jgi:hypothetical protein
MSVFYVFLPPYPFPSLNGKIILMFSRTLAILGILISLFGVIVVPGVLRKRSWLHPYAIHRVDPDEPDIPWDLTNSIPTGWTDIHNHVTKKEWSFSPRFERIK